MPTSSRRCVAGPQSLSFNALAQPRLTLASPAHLCSQEEKKRKLLKVRLEMAKFLQETIREGGLNSRDKIKQSEEFKEFFRKVRPLALSPSLVAPPLLLTRSFSTRTQVRSTGESPSTEEVVRVARLFEDDLTLENLSRPQLVSMCRCVLSLSLPLFLEGRREVKARRLTRPLSLIPRRYMNINAFGTDIFLRFTIRNRLQKLKDDDKVIASEGLDALSTAELQAACQSRGIRTLKVSDEHLRSELQQWLDLHLHYGLSGTLLILSKAFAFNRAYGATPEGEAGGDEVLKSLKDTLASLPDNLVNEAELEVSSDSASYKQRLEVLQQQEELIEDEEEQEAKEAEARRVKKEAEEDAKREEAEKKREAEEQEKAAKEADQVQEMLPESEVRPLSLDSSRTSRRPRSNTH